MGVLLQHPRNMEQPAGFSVEPQANGMTISFADGWLEERPLTRADLHNEIDYLAKQDFKLIVT